LREFPQPTQLGRSTYQRVAARWSELELPGPPPKLDLFHGEQVRGGVVDTPLKVTMT
jgi:hypothetical protein